MIFLIMGVFGIITYVIYLITEKNELKSKLSEEIYQAEMLQKEFIYKASLSYTEYLNEFDGTLERVLERHKTLINREECDEELKEFYISKLNSAIDSYNHITYLWNIFITNPINKRFLTACKEVNRVEYLRPIIPESSFE